MVNDIKQQSLSEFLKKKFRDIMNDHADSIAGGGCKDFAEYKRGVIEGLAIAEREVLDWVDRNTREQELLL